MFLCDDCTNNPGFFRSRGPCEGCGRLAACSEVTPECYVPPVAPSCADPTVDDSSDPSKHPIIQQAIRFVFEHWVETGDASTLSEIANGIGISDSTLRRRMNQIPRFNAPDAMSHTKVERTIRNGSGISTGHRSVGAYLPSDAHIRREIQALREREECYRR